MSTLIQAFPRPTTAVGLRLIAYGILATGERRCARRCSECTLLISSGAKRKQSERVRR